jgi:hypothetical protein
LRQVSSVGQEAAGVHGRVPRATPLGGARRNRHGRRARRTQQSAGNEFTKRRRTCRRQPHLFRPHEQCKFFILIQTIQLAINIFKLRTLMI